MMSRNDWVDFHAVKEAVSRETVLRHYQVPGLRRRREQLEGRCPIHRESATIRFGPASLRIFFIASLAKRRATFWILSSPWSSARFGRPR